MYAQMSVVVMMMVVGGCFGFYPGFISGSGGPRRYPTCALSTKPCRLRVTMHNFNGDFVSEMTTQTCTCASPNTCSSDWSLSSHVISRTLISTNYNMTLNMMFCESVQPQQYCGYGDEALVVSGAMTLPQNVETFNCRCSGDSPLVLHQRRIGSDHLTYNTYVCDHHKATCPRRISQCLSIRQDVTNYHCKCPEGLHCRVIGNTWGNDVTGYCRV